MSQASRGHAQRFEGWRRQVARELSCLEGATLLPVLTFDVHAALMHARSLIALEAEQDRFEAWTRARGLGPENREPGAFVSYSAVSQPPDPDMRARGGWPGKLARSWPGDSRAPMGRSLARLGRRIEAALRGQPSECQSATRKLTRILRRRNPTCTMCRGTGHNLRGVLPSLEWPAQARRKAGDGLFTDDDDSKPDDWTDRVPLPDGFDHRDPTCTRVCPRGTHRDLDPGERVANLEAHAGPVALRYDWQAFFGREPDLEDYVELDGDGGRCGYDFAAHNDAGDRFARETSLLPGWRIGELAHDERRRRRSSAE